ncbi:hypothetical protein HZY86_04330 [Aerococcaceae bacterium DSM 111020]|nr:hypothetical protein [Aerococcaceae bacterium DSM 111020]
MKELKNRGKLVTILVAVFFLVSSIPTVYAQETNWEEVLTQITEANKTLPSLSGTGDANISVVAEEEPQFAGNYNFDFRYNVEPRFSAELSLNGNTSFPVNEYDEDWNVVDTFMQEEPTNFTLTVVEGILYVFDGSSWTVEDISELEKQASDEYYQTLEEVENSGQNDITPELVSFYEKYFNLSETDTDYVFTLKENVNSEEFWNDLEASSNINIEAKKQEAIEQAIAQIEEQTEEPMTPEEKSQFEETYNKSFDLALKIGQNITVSYDKASYIISGMTMDLQITEADIKELIGEEIQDEDLGGLLIELAINLTFDEQGQTFDIQVPADAPTFNDDSSTESISSDDQNVSSEESTESNVSEDNSMDSIEEDSSTEASSSSAA